MKISFGSFQEQSRQRKFFNILGVVFAAVVFLELLLRGLGFLISLQVLHFSQISPTADHNSTQTIVCIGDSWTAGQPSGNYPDALQATLNTMYPNLRFQVVNLGIAGFNSSQGIQRLLDNLPTYQPEIVIVMIGNNDHWNLSGSAYWQFADQKLDALSIWEAKVRVWLHSLRVYKLFKIIYSKLTGNPTPNQFYYINTDEHSQTSEQPVAIDRQIHRKQLEYNLLKFIELAEMYDFHVVLQTYFHFHGYHVNEIIRDVAITYHIPLVDNNLRFHEKIAVEDREHYLVPDGHPNPAGYEFIADNIVNVLQAEKLIP